MRSDREVADRHRRPQAVQLLRRLDHARPLDRRLHAHELDAARDQALGRLRIAAVDGEASVAAAVPQDQARDLLGPLCRLLTGARAGEKVGEGRAGPQLVDGCLDTRLTWRLLANSNKTTGPSVATKA